jgi:protein-S-isoprenylcysteine O-methyltransferase Ste14
MNAKVFHIIFATAIFSMIALRIYYGRKARHNRSDVEIRESKQNMAIRAFFGLGYVGAMIVYIFTPSLFAWAIIPLPGWTRWTGAIITAGSMLLLWWVQWALDVQFDTTLHTQAEHRLIVHGPYRWVRHPMYKSLFLMGLGWSLLSTNWFVGIPLMIGIILLVLSRVQKEEDMLINLFGDEYRNYMKETGRFLPLLKIGS